jgi:hypothetical protein
LSLPKGRAPKALNANAFARAYGVDALRDAIDDGWTAARGPDDTPRADWPEPDHALLDDRRGDLPEFPDNVMPDAVGALTRNPV